MNAPLMNAVRDINETMQAEDKQVVPDIRIVPGELSDAFARLDPDLAYLHKDMLSALAQLNQAQRDGTAIDMISWRYESAKSAYQTRLIEVRENKMLNRTELTAEEKDEKRVLHELSMQDRMNENFARIREKRIQKKKRDEQGNGGWFFYFIIGMMVAQMNARRLEMDQQISNNQNPFGSSGTQ